MSVSDFKGTANSLAFTVAHPAPDAMWLVTREGATALGEAEIAEQLHGNGDCQNHDAKLGECGWCARSARRIAADLRRLAAGGERRD